MKAKYFRPNLNYSLETLGNDPLGLSQNLGLHFKEITFDFNVYIVNAKNMSIACSFLRKFRNKI